MIVLNALQNRNINDVRKLKNLSKPFTKGHGNDSSFGKARSNVPLADNNKGNNNSCGRYVPVNVDVKIDRICEYVLLNY